MSITESTIKCKDFIKSFLPLYHGPIVEVKVGNERYKVSKLLLCKVSPYFMAMLNGKFKEGETQMVALEEVEGIVSVSSFETFLQCLYRGNVGLDYEAPGDGITAVIEFARLADMLGLSEIETGLAESIKALVLLHKPSIIDFANTNIWKLQHITAQHLNAAMCLPRQHAVRLLFVKAAVDTFLHAHEFKFVDELRRNPEFASDLLHELHNALITLQFSQYKVTYLDPFTGESLRFRPIQAHWHALWRDTNGS